MVGRKEKRTFDYEALANKKWDMDIVTLVARIHECKGDRTYLFAKNPQNWKGLLRLQEYKVLKHRIKSRVLLQQYPNEAACR